MSQSKKALVGKGLIVLAGDRVYRELEIKYEMNTRLTSVKITLRYCMLVENHLKELKNFPLFNSQQESNLYREQKAIKVLSVSKKDF
jgi:hypothetical protein